ncbi:MAG TPA: glycosyltransferase family 39 protein [Solirubrobacteraceae bacterium]|jgi:hypothetical protein|nr:glycosyltransferase family 39 protein [Solirubrobacteraceae bacterium]
MSALAATARARRLAGVAAVLRAPRLVVPRIVLGLLAVAVVSYHLRSTALHARYWIDEGLSIGISSHGLLDIPGILRQDGSPPVYYLLLAVWTSLFGDGEARTHMLSLIFALLTIPAGFFVARTIFDERSGWFVAVLCAVNPFLNYYAQETRMYSLVVLLSMLAAGTFALAYVQGRRRWLGPFVACGTLLIYTHNWGLFTMAGTVVALVPLLWRRRVPWRDVLIGYGAIAVLYLPWVPTLLFQAAHTAAPWSGVPKIQHLPGDLASLAGGAGPGVAILLAGGAGLAAYLARREPGSGERTPQTRAATSIAIVIVAAIVLAFVSSQISPSWTTRYFAAIIGPLALFVGAVLARAGNLGLATLAVLAGLWLHPPTAAVNGKSDAHRVANVVAPLLHPGDLVVSTHPEQLTLLHFYFPPGLRWANGMGFVETTDWMDWRDALDRYKAARPTATARKLIATLRPGQQLVLVQPIIATASWGAPWTSLVRRRARQWERALGRDPRLVREEALPKLRPRRLPRGVRVVLYMRR